MSFDNILGDLSSGLRRRDIRNGAPGRLGSAILAGIEGGSSGSGNHLVVPGLCGGLAAVGFAVSAVVAGRQHASHHPQPPASARQLETPASREAARIATAVDRKNSWHLSGVRHLVRGGRGGGGESRWEEWERRSPYFYREEIDGETIIDDGQSVVHIIPPRQLPADVGKGTQATMVPGRVVIRKSEGPVFRTLDGSGLLANDPRKTDAAPDIAGKSPTPGTAGSDATEQIEDSSVTGPGNSANITIDTQRDSTGNDTTPDSRYTRQLVVNSQSHLPVRFFEQWTDSARLAAGKPPSASQEIHAEYDCELSSSVTGFTVRRGYTLIDLTASTPAGRVGAPTASNQPKLQITPEVLGQDSSGTCAIKLHVDFGLGRDLHDALSSTLDNFSAADDAGNTYVVAAARTTDPFAPALLIAAADPEAARFSHPSRILINCDAFVSRDDIASKLKSGLETAIPSTIVLQIDGKFHQAAIGDAFSMIDPKGAKCTVLESIAIARANFYGARERPPLERHPQRPAGAATGLVPVLIGPGGGGGHGMVHSANQARPGSDDANRAAYWWDIAANEAESVQMHGAARHLRYRATEFRAQ